ncbi:uncharacterized protein MONOS_10579 [Monocercomonoides exilis]|uniref:uncharacterized protein n=1 Tax=Monocercomonoides exilis TaxID=2049356 RepID=UPI003559E25D|nr:hypothetical protein MONOS_10579 [Monocercomonoides exilis]|eukprot:MONOS_10579.1-p1 / transcript=MONOS_10579.1 / gene=MONOS_10579 / organism=Monocercomonoides_exilis_PA203 / gene_product=unspecified product / transcript_product=unspecified product / location=Mono_scaffold00486:19970-27901(-) / protein_length=2643 / sequence_SO=supercontig / SO=protein_coding / is_pseudo=false
MQKSQKSSSSNLSTKKTSSSTNKISTSTVPKDGKQVLRQWNSRTTSPQFPQHLQFQKQQQSQPLKEFQPLPFQKKFTQDTKIKMCESGEDMANSEKGCCAFPSNSQSFEKKEYSSSHCSPSSIVYPLGSFPQLSCDNSAAMLQDFSGVSPKLNLETHIGFTPTSILWLIDNCIAFPSGSSIVILAPDTHAQRILSGHTAPITVMGYSPNSGLIVSVQSAVSIPDEFYKCYTSGFRRNSSIESDSILRGSSSTQSSVIASSLHSLFLPFTSNKDTSAHLRSNSQSLLKSQSSHVIPSLLCVWDVAQGVCIAAESPPLASIVDIAVCVNGERAVLIGRDDSGKHSIAVYDLSRVRLTKKVTLIARCFSQFPLTRVKLFPGDSTRFATCGPQNVRLWRIKAGQLKNMGIGMKEQSRMTFTDLVFLTPDIIGTSSGDVFGGMIPTPIGRNLQAEEEDSTAGASGADAGGINMHSSDPRSLSNQKNANKGKSSRPGSRKGKKEESESKISSDVLFHPRMLVATKEGSLLLCDVDEREVECRFTLFDHSIPVVGVVPSFCIVGSSQGVLSVWPLTFGECYIDITLSSGVTCLSPSPSRQLVAVGTVEGQIGILDITTGKYRVVYRSHEGKVYDVSVNPNGTEFATVASDGTVRVWDTMLCARGALWNGKYRNKGRNEELENGDNSAENERVKGRAIGMGGCPEVFEGRWADDIPHSVAFCPLGPSALSATPSTTTTTAGPLMPFVQTSLLPSQPQSTQQSSSASGSAFTSTGQEQITSQQHVDRRGSQLLAIGFRSGTIILHDTALQTTIGKCCSVMTTIMKLLFDRVGRFLFAALMTGNLLVLESTQTTLFTKQVRIIESACSQQHPSLSVSVDNNWLASISADPTRVFLISLKNLQLVNAIRVCDPVFDVGRPSLLDEEVETTDRESKEKQSNSVSASSSLRTSSAGEKQRVKVGLKGKDSTRESLSKRGSSSNIDALIASGASVVSARMLRGSVGSSAALRSSSDEKRAVEEEQKKRTLPTQRLTKVMSVVDRKARSDQKKAEQADFDEACEEKAVCVAFDESPSNFLLIGTNKRVATFSIEGEKMGQKFNGVTTMCVRPGGKYLCSGVVEAAVVPVHGNERGSTSAVSSAAADISPPPSSLATGLPSNVMPGTEPATPAVDQLADGCKQLASGEDAPKLSQSPSDLLYDSADSDQSERGSQVTVGSVIIPNTYVQIAPLSSISPAFSLLTQPTQTGSSSGDSPLDRVPQSFPGHYGIVTAAAFTTDGNRLITAGSGGEINVWCVADELKPHDAQEKLKQKLEILDNERTAMLGERVKWANEEKEVIQLRKRMGGEKAADFEGEEQKSFEEGFLPAKKSAYEMDEEDELLTELQDDMQFDEQRMAEFSVGKDELPNDKEQLRPEVMNPAAQASSDEAMLDETIPAVSSSDTLPTPHPHSPPPPPLPADSLTAGHLEAEIKAAAAELDKQGKKLEEEMLWNVESDPHGSESEEADEENEPQYEREQPSENQMRCGKGLKDENLQSSDSEEAEEMVPDASNQEKIDSFEDEDDRYDVSKADKGEISAWDDDADLQVMKHQKTNSSKIKKTKPHPSVHIAKKTEIKKKTSSSANHKKQAEGGESSESTLYAPVAFASRQKHSHAVTASAIAQSTKSVSLPSARPRSAKSTTSSQQSQPRRVGVIRSPSQLPPPPSTASYRDETATSASPTSSLPSIPGYPLVPSTPTASPVWINGERCVFAAGKGTFPAVYDHSKKAYCLPTRSWMRPGASKMRGEVLKGIQNVLKRQKAPEFGSAESRERWQLRSNQFPQNVGVSSGSYNVQIHSTAFIPDCVKEPGRCLEPEELPATQPSSFWYSNGDRADSLEGIQRPASGGPALLNTAALLARTVRLSSIAVFPNPKSAGSPFDDQFNVKDVLSLNDSNNNILNEFNKRRGLLKKRSAHTIIVTGGEMPEAENGGFSTLSVWIYSRPIEELNDEQTDWQTLFGDQTSFTDSKRIGSRIPDYQKSLKHPHTDDMHQTQTSASEMPRSSTPPPHSDELSICSTEMSRSSLMQSVEDDLYSAENEAEENDSREPFIALACTVRAHRTGIRCIALSSITSIPFNPSKRIASLFERILSPIGKRGSALQSSSWSSEESQSVKPSYSLPPCLFAVSVSDNEERQVSLWLLRISDLAYHPVPINPNASLDDARSLSRPLLRLLSVSYAPHTTNSIIFQPPQEKTIFNKCDNSDEVFSGMPSSLSSGASSPSNVPSVAFCTGGEEGVDFWDVEWETDWEAVWRSLTTMSSIQVATRAHYREMRRIQEVQQQKMDLFFDKDRMRSEEKESGEYGPLSLAHLDNDEILSRLSEVVTKQELIDVIEEHTQFRLKLREGVCLGSDALKGSHVTSLCFTHSLNGERELAEERKRRRLLQKKQEEAMMEEAMGRPLEQEGMAAFVSPSYASILVASSQTLMRPPPPIPQYVRRFAIPSGSIALSRTSLDAPSISAPPLLFSGLDDGRIVVWDCETASVTQIISDMASSYICSIDSVVVDSLQPKQNEQAVDKFNMQSRNALFLIAEYSGRVSVWNQSERVICIKTNSSEKNDSRDIADDEENRKEEDCQKRVRTVTSFEMGSDATFPSGIKTSSFCGEKNRMFVGSATDCLYFMSIHQK